MVGRFINADEIDVLLLSSMAISYNAFAYCSNMPTNCADFTGCYPYDLFSSANTAVYDFAKLFYNISLYIRFEISSVVYAKKIKGKTYYSYTPYIIGQPHSCAPAKGEKYVPKGAWVVAYIHTHPNSNSFSSADKKYALSRYKTIYVITPNRSIRSYGDTRRGFADKVIYTGVRYDAVPKAVKNMLLRQYLFKWIQHLQKGCDFNCSAKKWPSF